MMEAKSRAPRPSAVPTHHPGPQGRVPGQTPRPAGAGQRGAVRLFTSKGSGHHLVLRIRTSLSRGGGVALVGDKDLKLTSCQGLWM